MHHQDGVTLSLSRHPDPPAECQLRISGIWSHQIPVSPQINSITCHIFKGKGQDGTYAAKSSHPLWFTVSLYYSEVHEHNFACELNAQRIFPLPVTRLALHSTWISVQKRGVFCEQCCHIMTKAGSSGTSATHLPVPSAPASAEHLSPSSRHKWALTGSLTHRIQDRDSISHNELLGLVW